ncbi:MAG TPA: vitamin K epoxide reductase family protein [Rubricoccaceae bacterium]|nr:vitamin K epoxide reductase family protein [Rubricoccaceae bacterium]
MPEEALGVPLPDGPGLSPRAAEATRREGGEAGIPPGWDYNPAKWGQRLPIVGLALVGFGIATYLALYQLRVVPTVWEPFFGDGSRTVLDSDLSRDLSRIVGVPDAALGAFGYLFDAVAGVVGGTRRWKTMPWMVILFGLAVGPLGVVSIALVVSQPLVVGAWCTLCLASAVVSLAMIGPAMDEMLASLQYLRRVRDAGLPFWKHFWGTA